MAQEFNILARVTSVFKVMANNEQQAKDLVFKRIVESGVPALAPIDLEVINTIIDPDNPKKKEKKNDKGKK